MLGATGLIGAAVSARLQAEGHHVVRLARSVRGNGIVADLAMLTHEEDWRRSREPCWSGGSVTPFGQGGYFSRSRSTW
ncbi:MAG: hypothetical protein ACTSRM_00215 [Alphaproteobacteria bacterium]